jgi:hypothetical protein
MADPAAQHQQIFSTDLALRCFRNNFFFEKDTNEKIN